MIEKFIFDEQHEKVQAAIQRALDGLVTRRFMGNLKTPSVIDDYSPEFNELVLVNPGKDITITLPKISGETVGQAITIMNTTNLTNNININPTSGDTYQGSQFGTTINAAYASKIIIAVGTSNWSEINSG